MWSRHLVVFTLVTFAIFDSQCHVIHVGELRRSIFLTNDFDLETRFDFEIIRRRQFELEPRRRKRFTAERTFEISRINEESDRHLDAQ